jgi:hypothetical protein
VAYNKMVEKIAPELWIKIFQYLTPVDLCFSISPINKFFYELSQDNQIWSQFKCDAWNEKSIQKKSKSSLLLAPKKDNLFKTLYINWIRVEGNAAKLNNTIPSWIVQNGKREVELVISSNMIMKNYQKLHTPLLAKISQNWKSEDQDKPIDQLKQIDQFNPVSETGLIPQLSDKNKDVCLLEHDLLFSRMPITYYISSFIQTAKGVFWAISDFNETEKNLLVFMKKGLDVQSRFGTHLMVLDYSQFENDPKPPIVLSNTVKKWFDESGIEFVENKEIGNALEKMIKILDTKHKNLFPKYLPTEDEFRNFVFNKIHANPLNKVQVQTQVQAGVTPQTKVQTRSKFFASMKKFFSKN